jgi:hypothetical protein
LIVFSPSPKIEPEAGVQLVATAPSTKSAAETENVAAAPDDPIASTLKSAGTVTVGAVVSTTVILKLLLAGFPLESVTEHETVVSPSEKVSPEFALQVGVNAPSTASLAETLKSTAAPDGPVASAVILDGTRITGAIVS